MRRNPASTSPVLDFVESELFLITAEVVLVGSVAALLWWALTKNAGTQAEGAADVWGYTPSPNLVGPNGEVPIPNPSQMSGANPLSPWEPPGPPA